MSAAVLKPPTAEDIPLALRGHRWIPGAARLGGQRRLRSGRARLTRAQWGRRLPDRIRQGHVLRHAYCPVCIVRG